MDLHTKLRGIYPTNTVFYSLESRAEVYCSQLILKYWNWPIGNIHFIMLWSEREIYLNDFVERKNEQDHDL